MGLNVELYYLYNWQYEDVLYINKQKKLLYNFFIRNRIYFYIIDQEFYKVIKGIRFWYFIDYQLYKRSEFFFIKFVISIFRLFF